jgi:hypothetical protein
MEDMERDGNEDAGCNRVSHNLFLPLLALLSREHRRWTQSANGSDGTIEHRCCCYALDEQSSSFFFLTTTTNVGKRRYVGSLTNFTGLTLTSRQLPSPSDSSSHGRWVRLAIQVQVYWISFSAGLRTFSKAFFKKNHPVKLYGLVQKRVETKPPGHRLWESQDVRIDRGETLAGSTNVVWQRQRQTKNPALMKIDSHAKTVTQQVSPSSDARKLQKDLFNKLG